MRELSNPENFNIDLGKKVFDFLTANPRYHDQGTVMDYDFAGLRLPECFDSGIQLGECGTAGCIAGWTIKFSGDRIEQTGDWAGPAQRLLGLERWEIWPMFSAGTPERDARAILGHMIEQAEEYRAHIDRRAEREEEKLQRAYDRAGSRRYQWMTLPRFRHTKTVKHEQLIGIDR
jgi:hypothetical protein